MPAGCQNRGDDLVAVEGVDARFAKGAGRAAVIATAQRFGGIFIVA